MTVAKRNKRVKPDPELVKLADSLLANYQKPEDLIGENGLLEQLTKMLVERALETEMSEHLGHGKSEAVTNATGNTRNGHSAKTLQGEFGELPLDMAQQMLGAFEAKWDKDYPSIGQSWRRNWERVIPFFDYPPEIRKVIYAPQEVPLGDTTNAIESINMSLRKVIKTRSSFPTGEAVTKLFYLALNNISKKWSMPIRDWKAALNRFTIQFEERLVQR